ASALPAQTAAELVAAAQRSFVDGLHTASSIGAVVLVATAVAAWFLLRGQRLEDGAGAHH
ncbi:MFS transporter, partial [Streptomyces sp. ZG43]